MSSFQMQSIISPSTTKLRHLHLILLIATTLLGQSLQSDISGYICDDLVLWHNEAIKVAKSASELLKKVDIRYKFPALFEDSQLFGLGSQNLFVVPSRMYGSMRSGGNKGRDRVVLDASGNFVGVVFDTNNGDQNPMPAYQKCRPFLHYNNPSLELYMERGYQITGFACGSNFLDRNIETDMQAKCTTIINLPPDIDYNFLLSQSKHVLRVNKQLWFRHFTNKNYDYKQIKTPHSYQIEFDDRCRFLNIRPVSIKKPRQEACLDTWTAISSPDATNSDSLFGLQSKNYQTRDEFYACKNYVFRITSILNYLFSIYTLLIGNQFSSIESITHKQDNNLLLWPIPLPERHGPYLKYPFAFALGLGENYQFSGIYYGYSKDWTKRKLNPCPDFDILRSRLERRALD